MAVDTNLPIEDQIAALDERITALETMPPPVSQTDFDQFKQDLHDAGIRLLPNSQKEA